MKITEIEYQKNNKDKVNIFVDGSYLFSLSVNGVAKYMLYKDKEITDEEISSMKIDDEKEIAYQYALKRISEKMYSRKELKDKLIKKGFLEDSIKYALDKASSYNYIDDTYYTKCFIEQRAIPNKWGKNIIKQKLYQKGIDKDLIEKSLDEYFTEEDSKDNCYELCVKKFRSLNIDSLSDRKNVDKIYRFLLSKGYSFDEINTSIEHLKSEIKEL